jgi:spore germination cell wall hydrolase CwlJ-like protein
MKSTVVLVCLAIAIFFCINIVDIESVYGHNENRVISSPLIDSSKDDEITCMSVNLYFEARSQKIIEQEAIAHVVMNRMLDKSFPNTVCDVVYDAKLDKAGIPIKNMCQFSWFCDGKPETISNRKLYEKSVEIAERVYYRSLSGERDPTEGALWYHAEYVTPYWAKTYTKQLQIGAHIFYSR